MNYYYKKQHRNLKRNRQKQTKKTNSAGEPLGDETESRIAKESTVKVNFSLGRFGSEEVSSVVQA